MADLQNSKKRKSTYHSLQDKTKTKNDCTPSNSTSTTVEGCHEIIQNLIENIVRLKVSEELGPAIIKAVQRTERRKVQVLIQKGANVNTKSDEGKSLLHLALNDLSLTKILIENGADIKRPRAFRLWPLLSLTNLIFFFIFSLFSNS